MTWRALGARRTQTVVVRDARDEPPRIPDKVALTTRTIAKASYFRRCKNRVAAPADAYTHEDIRPTSDEIPTSVCTAQHHGMWQFKLVDLFCELYSRSRDNSTCKRCTGK